MKKAIMVMSILCAGLVLAGPIIESYATDFEQSGVELNVAENKKDVEETVIQKEEVKEEKVDKQEAKKEDKVNKKETKQEAKKEDKADKNEVKKEEKNDKEETKIDEEKEASYLTKEQALKLLKEFEPCLEYDYVGNEDDYSAIKENGISGYVFLPRCETDMGYLVDKANGNIYFFHPSGYFELLN